MFCCRSTIVGLVAIIAILDFAEASHFRGAIIQWRPVNPENFDGQVQLIVMLWCSKANTIS